MKHLLARASAGLLDDIGRARVVLAFDFDGTLAPIVADREAAAMRRETSALLASVAAVYPCAVISGRGRADVARRLGRARVKYVVGNHGLEPDPGLVPRRATRDLGASLRAVRRARRTLEAKLADVAGVEIEDKRYSLSVHYRAARSKHAALREIDGAIAALGGDLSAIPGKLVVNVVPAGAPNKADALLEVRRREAADLAVYVGDDVTDEDVFRLDQPERLVSVRVGLSRSSAAAYFVRCQREVDDALEQLFLARSRALRA